MLTSSIIVLKCIAMPGRFRSAVNLILFCYCAAELSLALKQKLPSRLREVILPDIWDNSSHSIKIWPSILLGPRTKHNSTCLKGQYYIDCLARWMFEAKPETLTFVPHCDRSTGVTVKEHGT
jgi:hypothetical protein